MCLPGCIHICQGTRRNTFEHIYTCASLWMVRHIFKHASQTILSHKVRGTWWKNTAEPVKGRDQVLTYGVPHHDVHICTEGIVNVLSDVEIEKITEVVVHVNTQCWERGKNVNKAKNAKQNNFFSYSQRLHFLYFQLKSMNKHASSKQGQTQVLVNLKKHQVQNPTFKIDYFEIRNAFSPIHQIIREH